LLQFGGGKTGREDCRTRMPQYEMDPGWNYAACLE
jgi:hypothetical protein